ncbi:MAG TPA: DALR domain-containing protein, partial [Ferruginibacter sp.]|nr:DALR domain-containing protein [Ferruginibacter sp.]
PMTIRFFILQSHYRSTLDFSSEALVASEKAMKRLWEAYEILQKLAIGNEQMAADLELDAKVNNWLDELPGFMDDDMSTPKVLANIFEMAPIINSLKDVLINVGAISPATLQKMKESFKLFLEDIMGLQNVSATDNETFQGVMQLLIEIRKEAKNKKDFSTSDKIRNQLTDLGIQLKDEKGGEMIWTVA